MKTSIVAAICAAALNALLAGAAYAAGSPPQSTRLIDAVDAATEYSDAHRSIGIVVYNGAGNSVSPSSIGDQFVTELRKRGVASKYFVAPMNSNGMGISYHLGAVAFGPMNLQDAASDMGRIVRMHQARVRLLAPPVAK